MIIPPNPTLCPAELALPDGLAFCELPVSHNGPHRASGPSHHPPGGEPVVWEIEPPLRYVVRTVAEVA